MAGGNQAMYEYMWGPTEFHVTGTLRDFDRTARLRELQLPVLLLGGEYDEVRPTTMLEYQRAIGGAERVIVPEAGHLTMLDRPEAVVAALRSFLHRVEGR